MRHRLPQFGKLLRIGGSRNRPHGSVIARAGCAHGQLFDECRHVTIEWLAVAYQVLEQGSSRIGGLHQDEYTGATLRGDFDERFQAIVSQVRTDRQRIAPPGADFRGPQVGLRIGRSG